MTIISLGIINKKLFFAVFAGLFKIVVNIILHHSKVKINSHPCFLGINASIGLCLSLFPFLYLKLRNRKIKGNLDIKSKANDDFLIYNNAEDALKRGSLLYILIIALLDCIQKITAFFLGKYFLVNFWTIDSLLLLLFSFLILKTKIYAHHLISLIVIMVIGIILVIIKYYNDISFFQIFITLFAEIFYCLENVVCKYVMAFKFRTPYEICFLVGFFDLFIFILLLIIFSNVPISAYYKVNKYNDEYIDSFSGYIKELDLKEILIFILLLFLRCIFILFGFIAINYFEATHIVLIVIIGEISFLFEDDYDWKLYVKIFFFIILIFFILVYVEILELNIFGIQKNTKKNITNRSENEDSTDDDNYDPKYGKTFEMQNQRESLNDVDIENENN